MIIQPRVRGFICTAAHPLGCKANIQAQIGHIQAHTHCTPSIKNALVIGATTGYGLSSALAAAFGLDMNVLGIGFERNAKGTRTATAGFYNAAAFLEEARNQGKFVRMILGDAFSDACKEEALEVIRNHMGKIDLIIYSLAAPSRIHPDTGERLQSVLKPIGQSYTTKSIHLDTGRLQNITLEPATEMEIQQTIGVMGGDDWHRWLRFLRENNVLADNAVTLAYSYIGPKLTHAIYTDGTVGRAKRDLRYRAAQMQAENQDIGLKAYISVNKAIVTQASAAIPAVPLYMAILFDIMKKRGTHEGSVEQITRLYNRLYDPRGLLTDAEGFIRMDDWEMEPEVQAEVEERWQRITDESLGSLADFAEYRQQFMQLFGFGLPTVDEGLDVDPHASEEGMRLL